MKLIRRSDYLSALAAVKDANSFSAAYFLPE